MSHHDPFLLQEMSHSESELDMQLSPGSGAVAVSCSALSLLSGRACPNSGPLKTSKPLQIRLLPTMTWVCREAPSIGQGKLSKMVFNRAENMDLFGDSFLDVT